MCVCVSVCAYVQAVLAQLCDSHHQILYTCVGPACVHFSQKCESVFLRSDELNHFPHYAESEREKKDGHNTLCSFCTRWELNGERNVMAAMGVECAVLNWCVCVHV